MAHRGRLANPRSSTFEDLRPSTDSAELPPALSLATRAIRASSAYRGFSLSSSYGEPVGSAYGDAGPQRPSSSTRDSTAIKYTSTKNLNESKSEGLWGVLTRKAKSILQDDGAAQECRAPGQKHPQMLNKPSSGQFHPSCQSPESYQKTESPTMQKDLGALTSSFGYIGGTIGNVLGEGLTIVEQKSADIFQETKKMHTRRKRSGSHPQKSSNSSTFPRMQTDIDTQLKASRDVANAMAAKAKLLLRELKIVKADLAFAKERCGQLEEENKVLRDSHEKGGNLEDDELIWLQLETLLAEKARLAHENSMYARENRFLHEVVEYHQLTMQDLVYLDEGIEKVTQVYPIQMSCLSPWPARESRFFVPTSPMFTPDPTSLPVLVPPPSVLGSAAAEAVSTIAPET